MKQIVLFFAITTYVNLLNAQSFTQITTGPLVNDNTSSFSTAWIDIDNDGDLDLFVTAVYAENDLLYINNGDKTFTKVTSGAMVNDGSFSEGATWADYDNDGDLDVFIAKALNQNNALFNNNGSGVLSQIVMGQLVNDGGDSRDASWGDYDNDGYVDLFVANYNQNNFLYHNEGNGTFTKITTGAIVTDATTGSHGATWGDYDNDGWIDLFVANFNSSNYLYHNNKNGTFTKVISGIVVSEPVSDSDGANWADYDNDGDLDLFVTNSNNIKNFLYQNNGNGTFTKVTTSDIVTDADASMGSGWADFDNDGDLDLFLSNTSVQSSSLYNMVYVNNNGVFTKSSVTNAVSNGRGISWGDYDNDGDLDLFIANEQNLKDLFFENTGGTNNWINMKIIGTVSNKASIGARVWVKAWIKDALQVNKYVTQMHEISAQTGYMSQNSLDVEFGFGKTTVIDSIIVRWPSGITCYFTNVPTNQFLQITENCMLTSNNSPLPVPVNFSVAPNPAVNGVSTVSYSLENTAFVSLEIINVLGEKVKTIFNGSQPAGTFRQTLDLSELPAGIYLVKFSNGKMERSQKIVK